MREIRQLADPSDKWSVEFDVEWLVHNGTLDELHKRGYTAASMREKDGTVVYLIANIHDLNDGSHIIFETTDQDELNRYINLILPPRS